MPRKRTKSWRKKIMRGCSRKKRGGKISGGVMLKGGSSLIPSDLTNALNYSRYSAGSVYNGLLGFPPPVNPLPWAQ